MKHVTLISCAVLLGMDTTAFAQVRRPTRTGPPTLSTTTPTPAPAPTLTVFMLTHDSISGKPGPIQPNGKVTLTGAAPAGGLTVTLSSDNPTASVPASVPVAAGATEATFPVTTSVVSAPTLARITARAGAVSLIDSIRVLLSIASVVAQNPGPNTGQWLVTLSGPAPSNGIRVTASLVPPATGSSHACYPYPAFTVADIAAGQTTGTITAQGKPSMDRRWDWEARYGGRSSPIQRFGVVPAGGASFDFPATLASGTTGTGVVRLNGRTPSYTCATSNEFAAYYDRQYTLTFSSNSAAVQVPSSARVDPDQSERSFIITAATVQTQQTATITVSVQSGTGPLVAIRQVSITVTP